MIGISFIIIGFIFSSFVDYGRYQALKAEANNLKLTITETRQKTLSAETTSRYGIYFATSSVVVFEGNNYTGNNPTNATTSFSGYTITTNFPGTTSKQIVFTRLTGEPSATGTVSIVQNQTNTTSTINIGASGLIE